MPLKTPTVTITQQVLDFMMIEVNDADISSTFSYIIVDNNQQAIRKGNFKGQIVQLRLSHIPEGKYQFILHQNDELLTTIPFEKKSAAFDKSHLFGKY
ncbi:MAG: hypothetical protein QM541_13100 [Flavobacterium sp.]|nr:hypothetical protein [Flavobacterium sp.]